MRIEGGSVSNFIYFVAVDATDNVTRETGLTSFTVYRSRNGAAAAAMTTPTINEVDATNMPGVYELLLDEDMDMSPGNLTEAMTFHITHAGMALVTREIELFRPTYSDGALKTTIATLASQTSFTLTDGPADDDALNGSALVIYDQTTAHQLCLAIVSDYTGSTKTVTLTADPGIFTMATGDFVEVIPAFLVGGLSDQAKLDVNAECDTALADYDAPTDAEMQARTIVAANYATAANLATVDTVVDGIKVVTDNLPNAGALTDLATATALATVDANVDTAVSGVITGAAVTGTLSTTEATSNLTGYADGQLIGRVIIWTSGNCEGEATDITDYANVNGLLTFTALTTAPGNGDTFKIV